MKKKAVRRAAKPEQKRDVDWSALNAAGFICVSPMGEACEDSYALKLEAKRGMLAVFDGCGGLGARRYEKWENHTGAYIAARTAAECVLEWYRGNARQLPSFDDDNARIKLTYTMKCCLDERFQALNARLEDRKSTLRGSMIRSLPTTASIALLDYAKPERLRVLFVWAGDSRGYLLSSSDGLCQCTRDHLLVESDAFENLYADSPLSNLISADGRYHLDSACAEVRSGCVVLTTTDGVFSYLPSPMHFEALLLQTLSEAASTKEWKARLRARIGASPGDDCTLALAVLGWPSFQALQAAFRPRLQALKAELEGVSGEDALGRVWQKYRAGYELYGACAARANEESGVETEDE